MGIYAADGSLKISVVDGSTWTGLYAANGDSINAVVAPSSGFVGAYHPSGAIYVTVGDGTALGYRAPNGALYVSETPYTAGGTRVTVASGSLNVLRNIASRGETYTSNTVTTTSATSRQKVRLAYKVRRASTSGIRFVFGNAFLAATTGQTNGAQTISIRKCALEVNGVTTPLTFSASRSANVAAGAIVTSDPVSVNLAVGDTVWFRAEYDFFVGANAYVHRLKTHSTNDGESGWTYDPANEVDDVDNTGAMSAPSGAATNFNVYMPMILAGNTPSNTRSYIGIGTSIDLGQVDENSHGAIGGSYLGRACWSAGKAFCRYALNGYKFNDVIAGHSLLDTLLPYHDGVILGGPTNDIIAGSTTAQIVTNTSSIMHQIHDICRASSSINYIIQCNILPRGTSTDKGVNPANFTPTSGFGSGGVRDTCNAALAAEVGVAGRINAFVDVSTPVQDTDPTKWKTRSFTTTLAAAMLNTASSASLNAAPTLYESLVFDPTNASTQLAPSTAFIARTVSGTGPYTVTTSNVSTVGVAQNSGNTVAATSSYDTVHPQPLANADMAVPLAAAL